MRGHGLFTDVTLCSHDVTRIRTISPSSRASEGKKSSLGKIVVSLPIHIILLPPRQSLFFLNQQTFFAYGLSHTQSGLNGIPPFSSRS